MPEPTRIFVLQPMVNGAFYLTKRAFLTLRDNSTTLDHVMK